MHNSSAHDAATAAAQSMAGLCREGQSQKLPPIQVGQVPVDDTEMAACLGALDIPFREAMTVTPAVVLDQGYNERRQHTTWWMGEESATRTWTDPEKEHAPTVPETTARLVRAWHTRLGFEACEPLHPLVAMRAAIDARRAWVEEVAAEKQGRAILPVTVAPRERFYATSSIIDASILRGSGYAPLAFNGRAFFLEETGANGMHAKAFLAVAAKHPQSAGGWMAAALYNLNVLKKHLSAQAKILCQTVSIDPVGGTTDLHLSAEAPTKLRDKFLKLAHA